MCRLWDTIGKVAAISQEVSKGASNAIRSDAARTEAVHSNAKPLQVYIDPASIKKYIEL